MLALTAAALSACSSKPVSDLYVLRVPEGALTSCRPSMALNIARPSAPNEYDSKRMAVMLDQNHLSYYTGAGWASPFPDQLHDFLSDAFTRQGLNVLEGTADTDNTHILRLFIHEADIIDVNEPVVHLRLTGTVTGTSGHATRFTINEHIPAAANHMPQIVDAYDHAAVNALGIINQTLKLKCSGS